MGAVWVAEHLALRTKVVVKFIASGLQGSDEAKERFSREAAAAAQVKSPHVVQTFDHGLTEDGVPYIVMELLEGRDLGAYLDERGRVEPELVLEIVAQLSRALDRAHAVGIVHRDIKPGNIFLCDQGGGEMFVKLLDFGIAKGVEMPRIDSATKTGAMIGSPFYMSPEQVLGSKNVDHRSDLWSVGVVAYEAMTGSKPFDAETMGGLAIKIHSEPLPLPSSANNALPPAVDAWFAKACARGVPDRFSSGKDLAETLARALGGEMPRSLEVPRISTGSNPDAPGRSPTLVAGATTEAGVVRGATINNRTRNRVLVMVASAVTLGVVSFAAVSVMRKDKDPGRPHAVLPDDKSQPPTQTSNPPPPTANTVATPNTTPTPNTQLPPPPAQNTSTAPSIKISHGGIRPGGTGSTPPPSSNTAAPRLPSATATVVAPPTSTGRDIF